LKVRYDAMYSTSRGYLDEILTHCGCDVESLHTHRDVLFGGGMPEPKPDQLGELIALIRADQADLGVATDGDADRFGVIDEQGNYLIPNHILLLLARHLLKNKGKTGAIVRTVATTHLLDNLAAKYNLELIETAVGFKYVGQQMRETSVLIGGEESGGLSVIGHIPEKDGILADMLIAEMIAYEGKPLSQLVTEAIADANGPLSNTRLDLHLTNEHKLAVLSAIPSNPPTEIAGINVKELGRKDGIKLYLEDGSWVLLRPSGTEPLIRVYIETTSDEKLAAIADFMNNLINGLK
jgi:phosphomannomutase